MLNLDNSVFIIALLVWFLMIVLNRIFFKPVGQVIEQRETKIETEIKLLESMTGDIENKSQYLEKRLHDAKKESARIKEELMKKGEEAREQLLARTRVESQKLLEIKMKELDAEITGAEVKLKQDISVFSDKLKEIFIG